MKSAIFKKICHFFIFVFIIGIGLGCLNDGGNIIPPAENHTPIAEDKSVVVDSYGSVIVTLSASDPDGDELTWIIDVNPSHGNISANYPEVTYTPHTDYYGSDSFMFYVNDGIDDSSAAIVNITVIPVPRDPSDLRATCLSNCQIQLDWKDNSDNEEGFRIERREGSDGEFNLVQTTGADVTSFTDSGLTEGASYYYRVYAFKVTGNSELSNLADEIAQSSPFFTGFSVSAGPHIIQISFTTVEDIAAKIEYGATSEYGSVTDADAPCQIHSLRIGGLEEGVAYHYRAVSDDMIRKSTDRTFATNGDPYADKNVYLDAVVEWNPKQAGPARSSWGGLTDENRMPINNGRALGPPTGTGSWTSGTDCTVIGINGSAAFRFDEGYYIFDGEGDDFITFEDMFAWGGECDCLCCELAHVEVSEDGATWYYNSAEMYDINPHPADNNDDYKYFNVEGLHGNNPTWANYTKDMQAQHIVDGYWADIEGVYVSKDFLPTDPYLGGNAFDLSTFYSKEDNSLWLPGAKMRYVRIVDDENILDGQDYFKVWCLGAMMHAAMGINVKKEIE